MESRIPCLECIKEIGKLARSQWEGSSKRLGQHIEPLEYFSIPHVPETSTILIFAGYTGEVARKINAAKFIFTDIMAESVAKTKKTATAEFRAKAEFIVCDANFVPLKDNSVDFAFSFEPLPLFDIPYFFLGLLRCARKGIIIANYRLKMNNDVIRKLIEKYELELKREIIEIIVKTGRRQNVERIRLKLVFCIATAHTKRKLAIDTEVIKRINAIPNKILLNPTKATIRNNELGEIRSSLRLNAKEFSESLERINILAEKLATRHPSLQVSW